MRGGKIAITTNKLRHISKGVFFSASLMGAGERSVNSSALVLRSGSSWGLNISLFLEVW